MIEFFQCWTEASRNTKPMSSNNYMTGFHREIKKKKYWSICKEILPRDIEDRGDKVSRITQPRPISFKNMWNEK